jgi:probable DNA repair protein
LYRLPQPLERALDDAATIVTADARQSFAVRLAWNERQRALGCVAWPSPDVVPLSTWLARAWSRGTSSAAAANSATLLTRAQERALWEQVVEASGDERVLLHPYGAARAALRSWQRIHDWAIDRRGLAPAPSEETRAFLSWAGLATQRIEELRCLDPARALWRCPLADDPSEGGELFFLGFDVELPSLRELRARLVARGLKVSRAVACDSRTAGSRLGLEDSEAELLAAARWARHRLERNPDDRLLIAIPDLARRRDQANSVFADALDSAALLSPTAGDRGIFALEASESLDRYPVVATALTAFELAAGEVAFDAVSRWLRSPYLQSGTSAAGSRAQLDIAIRRYASEELDLRRLIAALTRVDGTVGQDHLLAALGDFAAHLAAGPRLPGEWTESFSRALQSIGWPGERPLDSAEHQTVEKFHDALREFAALNRLLGRIDLAAAARTLRRLAEQTPFQPETGDTAVTITARLDDPVLHYDGIWVSGLHAGAWPQAPSPDPFIPWPLQVAAGIPEASAAGELERGKRILSSWLASSEEVIVSWPRRLDDEDCDPSPLIGALPDAPTPAAAASTLPFAHVVHESAQLERLADETAPPVTLAGDLVANARTMTLQSRCPFRSFAEGRLGAGIIEQPQAGIDARTRGQFMHRALEQLGKTLGDSDALQRRSPEQRLAEVDAALRVARQQVLERPRRWSPATLDLETERLHALLCTWVEMESARTAFRILALEHEVNCTLAGLPFRLRIDRIDELGDGRHLLIDYKSGRANARSWYGERPDDAQMPLYAVAIATPPQALAYAVLNADGCRLEGVSTEPQIMAGIEVIEEWEAQRGEWRGVIERLAADFAAGRAQVDPTREACSDCHLHSLCRIDELRARGPVGADDE